MKKVACMIVPGDKVTDQGMEAVVLRGPRTSKWTAGIVHFEVETKDGRVYRAKYRDTERVDVR